MPPERQVGVRGKVIGAQSREIIANVLRFMKKEAAKGAPIIPLASFKQRLMEATGISDTVYRQVTKEMELIDAGKLGGFTAPSRCRKPIEIVEIKEEKGAAPSRCLNPIEIVEIKQEKL